ncbi:MAG: 4-hydroxybenzoate 3-monooxygenase [Tistlia sp.]|uniref:4-hydroxybenzoate 3-monooxygenase n=1 Tax=Tistlia sp. TaxID=3057121 RepID=UPI0034A569F0
MRKSRTQVGIVGAGPAGLVLAQRLARHGVESVVLERRDRAYVEARIRAGVLEQHTVELLAELGVGARLKREGLVHEGLEICLDGERSRLDLAAATGGKRVTVYGQTEVTKDLIAARLAAGLPLVFEAEEVRPLDLDGERPRLLYRKEGVEHELTCDFVAGCDGFHGVCRASLPEGALSLFERSYPFAWLGVLAEAPPAGEELIYARSARGFALYSMRSPTVARHYLQCRPDEDLAQWPLPRIWDELRRRLGRHGDLIVEGPVTDVSVTPMRSFVAEPMRHGRLFLAGDAAHIVPPTGAKGLNLAVVDVRYLSDALIEFYESGSQAGLEAYSDKALARIWKAQRFSWWMTSLLHTFGPEQAFEDRIRQAELSYLLSSEAARTALAENYVGLPL